MNEADIDPAPAHTVLSVLRGAEQWLHKRGVDAPKRSAELLLGHVLGVTRLQLYMAHDRPLDPQERAALRTLVARRGEGEPIAYLLGSQPFRGLELLVSPAVLIPRPETEELVDLVLARLPDAARVLDLGTGSGAIAIALARERPDCSVLATDLSAAALRVAAANVARHGLTPRIELREGAWWDAVPAGARFDVVVSNPPYVDPSRPELLAAEVRRFEPALALFAPAGDPAACYRAIGVQLAARLVPSGWFLAETGLEASVPAREWLEQLPGFTAATLLPDLGGQSRFLLAQRQPAADRAAEQMP